MWGVAVGWRVTVGWRVSVGCGGGVESDCGVGLRVSVWVWRWV